MRRGRGEGKKTSNFTSWPNCCRFLRQSPVSSIRPRLFVSPSRTLSCATSRTTLTCRGFLRTKSTSSRVSFQVSFPLLFSFLLTLFLFFLRFFSLFFFSFLGFLFFVAVYPCHPFSARDEHARPDRRESASNMRRQPTDNDRQTSTRTTTTTTMTTVRRALDKRRPRSSKTLEKQQGLSLPGPLPFAPLHPQTPFRLCLRCFRCLAFLVLHSFIRSLVGSLTPPSFPHPKRERVPGIWL